MFHYIKYGVKNLIKWFYIIWYDRDWDYTFLYEIIRFKLKNMEHLQRNYSNSVDSEKYADEIKEVIEALERLIKEDYVAYEEMMNGDVRKSIEKENELIKRDLSIVFDGMKNNSRNWWD